MHVRPTYRFIVDPQCMYMALTGVYIDTLLALIYPKLGKWVSK